MPEAIYDTQIAGVFLGYGDLAGLAKVIKAELDIELEKDQTRTDWSRRPLTDKQLEYAINDVRYLAPLYERYLDKLTEAQQAALTEDFEALLNEDLYRLAPENAADKIKAVQKLPRKAQAIAYRLTEWRELYAINHNKPKRWVLSDDALVAIAKRPPKAREALYKVPNIKASSVKNFGDEWIEIIDDVFANPDAWPEAPNKPAPATPQEDIFINIGFALLQQVAQDYHINPPNIAGKTDLLRLIRQPETRLAGWRQALFGQPFSDFLKGNIGLTCDNQRLIQKTFTP
jgi:ribonuclease D